MAQGFPPWRLASSQPGSPTNSTDSLQPRAPDDTEGILLEFTDSPVCEPLEQPDPGRVFANDIATPANVQAVEAHLSDFIVASTSEQTVRRPPGDETMETANIQSSSATLCTSGRVDATARICSIVRASSDPQTTTRRSNQLIPGPRLAPTRSALSASHVSGLTASTRAVAEISELEQVRRPEETVGPAAQAPDYPSLLQEGSTTAKPEETEVGASAASVQRPISAVEQTAIGPSQMAASTHEAIAASGLNCVAKSEDKEERTGAAALKPEASLEQAIAAAAAEAAMRQLTKPGAKQAACDVNTTAIAAGAETMSSRMIVVNQQHDHQAGVNKEQQSQSELAVRTASISSDGESASESDDTGPGISRSAAGGPAGLPEEIRQDYEEEQQEQRQQLPTERSRSSSEQHSEALLTSGQDLYTAPRFPDIALPACTVIIISDRADRLGERSSGAATITPSSEAAATGGGDSRTVVRRRRFKLPRWLSRLSCLRKDE